jgi:1,4-alpha-glucan branching enzyme
MIKKVPSHSGKIRVTFSLPATIWADTIHLVGDFNHWSTSATPLKLDEVAWSVSIDLDIGQSYQYRYLINNTEWNHDWHADDFVIDKRGIGNSVIVTALS